MWWGCPILPRMFHCDGPRRYVKYLLLSWKAAPGWIWLAPRPRRNQAVKLRRHAAGLTFLISSHLISSCLEPVRSTNFVLSQSVRQIRNFGVKTDRHDSPNSYLHVAAAHGR